MKKILFVTTVSGFLPQFERNDVKILRDKGCEIHYASNFKNPIYVYNKEDLKEMGLITHQIDVEKSPKKLKAHYKTIKELIEIIDNEGIDVVHCHNPMGGADARIAAWLSKRKPYVIYTAHGFHFYKGAGIKNWVFFYTAEKFFAKFTDLIITINKEDYERSNKFKLKKNGRTFQIHSVGVDSERFRPGKVAKREIRKELNIPEDAFHIVTAAELNDNKNQSVIIEAISKLDNKDIYYSICGKGPNEEKLNNLIKEKGLEDRVKLLGFCTNMDEILQSADCFAFPSKREGLGVAAVEALLSGVPLIAADNRGTREYLINDVNGIVCNADSSDEFSLAIYELFSNRDELNMMQKRCRNSATKFTVEEVETTMRDVYSIALGERV